MWEGKSMTEKSEDQVVWVCQKCFTIYNSDMSDFDFHCAYGDEGINDGCCVSTSKPNIPYIPHSKYLALKSDLEKAVEALREIKECGSKTVPQTFPWYISRMIGIAKEALGKIGGGK
jgi:hypothetical protein